MGAHIIKEASVLLIDLVGGIVVGTRQERDDAGVVGLAQHA